jgi:tRNA(Ile)-lysidine synthase
LKKLFIERRVPVRNRELIPVIADDNGVLAVYGIGMGNRAIPVSGDLAFQIIFEET